MKKRTNRMIIASAVGATLAVGACSQKPPEPGKATMVLPQKTPSKAKHTMLRTTVVDKDKWS